MMNFSSPLSQSIVAVGAVGVSYYCYRYYHIKNDKKNDELKEDKLFVGQRSNMIDYCSILGDNGDIPWNGFKRLSFDLSNKRFTEAYSTFLEYFDNEWPPRAEFNNWPKEYKIYMNICDEMAYEMDKLNDIGLFRKWMYERFIQCISNENIWFSIKKQLSKDMDLGLKKHNEILFGLLGCLTKLMVGYR